jgi:hypothetical protein
VTKDKDPGRREYFREYNKKSRVRISLNLNKDTDKDILEVIDKEDPRNKQAAVKSLIRKSITSGKL